MNEDHEELGARGSEGEENTFAVRSVPGHGE